MNSKNITHFFLAFIAVLLWNSFLIKRDQQLFDAYEKQAAIEQSKNPTVSSIKSWCNQQAGWHPDCNSK